MSTFPSLADFGVVDTHVHFFDRAIGDDEWWPYLRSDASGLTQGVAAVQGRKFTPAELRNEAQRLAGVSRCVHVESAHGLADPLLETRWLDTLRSRYGSPDAAVVRVALDEDSAERQIEEQCSYTFVRGIRDLGKNRLLATARYVDRARRLGRLGLVFEVLGTFRSFPDLAALANSCHDTQIILEHFGLAPRPARPEFKSWVESLRFLARCENVAIKLSGLGLIAKDWSMDEARVLVYECLSAFGAQRCMFGSNFPIDRASNAYPDAVAAVAFAMAELSEAERRRVLSKNAEEIYRL